MPASHTAKIVMKFLLYDKVKYFYQHFSLVAFESRKNSLLSLAKAVESGLRVGRRASFGVAVGA